MSTALLTHEDLDGLYSALLILKNGEYEIDNVIPINYGNDVSYIKNRYDHFIILDYADNVCGSKTILWVDHHLRQKNSAIKSVLDKSPSCVRLILEKNLVDRSLISEETVRYIDIVDSANYIFNSDFSMEDVIFPEPKKSELSKFILLNGLLSKNRKTNIIQKLLLKDTCNIDILLDTVEKSKELKVVKYNDYIKYKMLFFEELSKNKSKYIDHFYDLPVLFTKKFTQINWKGYDRNIYSYITHSFPFIVVVTEMNGKIGFQVAKNIFNKKNHKKSIYDMLSGSFSTLRGHEDILNFSYINKDKAIRDLDIVMDKLSKNIK